MIQKGFFLDILVEGVSNAASTGKLNFNFGHVFLEMLGEMVGKIQIFM